MRRQRWFKEEIEEIRGSSIDIAFFPVDPRLDEYYGLGAEYFIREIKPSHLVPMHFSVWFEGIADFESKTKGSGTEIIQFTEKGQVVSLKIK